MGIFPRKPSKLPSPPSVRSHRTCLFPPTMSSDNMYNIASQGNSCLSRRLSVQGFNWGLSHRHSLLCIYQNSRLSEVFQYKPYFLQKQFRYNEPFMSSGNGETPIEIQGHRCQLTDNLTRQSVLSKDSLRPAMLTFFCTIFI